MKTTDQILLGVAVAAALASFARFGWHAPTLGREHRIFLASANSASVGYVPVDLNPAAAATQKWLPPAVQARGTGWIYEVFTPPEIFYDARTRQFAVTPPDDASGAKAQAAEFELVAVKREPFRLQLVGYVGGEGSYRGTFENRNTNEVFLAEAGEQVPALELEITDFAVRREPVHLRRSMISNQRVATAVVHDGRTGRNLMLTAGEIGYAEELSAIFATTDGDDESVRELREGEEFQSSDHVYRVGRLQLDPPTAELTQISPTPPQPSRLNLTATISRNPPTEDPAN